MISLFIDTSDKNLIISLLDNDKMIDSINLNDIRNMSSELLSSLSSMCIKNNININDVSKIFVVNGPGSFTGIRIGVTVAKTIAYCLNIPIITLSSLEILASSSDSDIICSLIDARRSYVYAGVYDNNLNIIHEDKYILLDTLLDNLKDKNVTFVSNYTFEGIEVIKPIINIEKLISKHINDETKNPHNVNPNYLKLTEAEENRKND